MVASLLKIVSTGMQDERLQPPKDQPDLGAFLTVMVKTGRYATNWSRIDFDTKPDFGSRAVIRLPTKGEMIGRIYLVTVMPDIRTQQQVAYYTRKPIRLANSNYTSFNMYEVGGYINTATFTCQPSSDIYGYGNFTGIQLDDLIVDGVYTLTFSIPVGAFSLLLTNRALNTSQFDILNSDTFMIVGGASQGGAGTNFLFSSYNGTEFQTIEAPQNITSGGIFDIAYNNTKYLAVGLFSSASRRIVIENPPNTTVSVSTDGYAYNIAFNGTIYVGVGSWTTGSMIWSNDGITWSDPVWPAGVASGQGNSVVWIASRSRWMAVGQWPATSPTGMISTSTDGKVWTAPTFIDTSAKISAKIAADTMGALVGNPDITIGYNGILKMWLTDDQGDDFTAYLQDTYYNVVVSNSYTGSNILSDIEALPDTVVYPSFNRFAFMGVINALIYNIKTGNTSDSYIYYIDASKTLLSTLFTDLTVNVSYRPPIPVTLNNPPKSAQTMFNATKDAVEAFYNDVLPLIAVPSLTTNINIIRDIVPYMNLYPSLCSSVAAGEGILLGNLTQIRNSVDTLLFNLDNSSEFSYNSVSKVITPTTGGSITLTLPTGLTYINGSSVNVANSLSILSNFDGTVSIYNTNTGIVTITNIQNIEGGFNNSAIYKISNKNTLYNVGNSARLWDADGSILEETAWTQTFPTYNCPEPVSRIFTFVFATAHEFDINDQVFFDAFDSSPLGPSGIDSINNQTGNVDSTTTYTITVTIFDSTYYTGVPSIMGNVYKTVIPPDFIPSTYIIPAISAFIPLSTSWQFYLGSTSQHRFKVSTPPAVLNRLVFSDIVFDTYANVGGAVIITPTNGGSLTLTISDEIPFIPPVFISGSSVTVKQQNDPTIKFDGIISSYNFVTGVIIINNIANISGSFAVAAVYEITNKDTFNSSNSSIGYWTITETTDFTITFDIDIASSAPTVSGNMTLKNGNIWNKVYTAYNICYNIINNDIYDPINSAWDIYQNGLISPPTPSLESLHNNLTELTNVLQPQFSSLLSVADYALVPMTSGIAKSIAINGSNITVSGIFRSTNSPPNNYAGSIIYSSDGGNTWIYPTDPGGRGALDYGSQLTATGNDVAWTGSIWVATGIWSTNTISLSEDGINWLEAVSPLNTTEGEGKAIAVNGTEMIIGGNWSSGNLTKASGTSLGAKWGTIIRPTDLDTDIVDINNVVYYSEGATTVYLLLGKWSDSTGLGFGTISASTNGTLWSSPAVVGNDTTLTNSRAYAAATNGTIWIAVGSWKTPTGTPVSIAISDNISGESWGNTQPPFNPGSIGEGYGIIYSQDLFIAVGSWISGYITISTDDGNNWSLPSKFIIGLITYTGTAYSIIETAIAPTATSKRYIIVGTFIDGEPNSLPKTIATIDIDDTGVISNVSFITIGFTSASSVAYSAVWNGLSGGQAFYVAVGQWSSGSIIVSNDLISWSSPIKPANVTGIGRRVAWNGAQFIATGDWTTGSVTTSVDGINWSTPSRPTNIVNNIATGAIWNGSTWLVCGNFVNGLGTNVGNIVPFSYGINFTLPVFPDLATTGTLFDVAWIPEESKWIGYGEWTNNSGAGYTTRSSDGLSWSSPESIPLVSAITTEGIFQLSVNVINTRIYLLGEFTLYPNIIISSPTGSTWSSIPTIFSGQGRCVVWNGSLWVVGGDIDLNDFNNSINGTIITSVDGITWSSPINPPIPQTPRVLEILSDNPDAANLGVDFNGELFNLAWNGSLFVGVGSYDLILGSISSNITFGIGQIITSPNGIDWTIREIASITAQNDAQLENTGYGVAWNGYLWVVVGTWSLGEDTATITTSTDGINWTQPISPQNVMISSQSIARDVAWNGYIWVAVGQWIDNDSNKLIISTSTDGIVWSNPINPSTYTDATLLSITWNGTIFIATGTVTVDEIEEITNGIIMRSEDGITWSHIINSDVVGIVAVVTKRSLPYTNPQTFDPTLSVYPEPSSPGNYRLSWLRNPIYGSGSQYMQNQNVTQTFTATQRTQWLTFGTYYNTTTPVTITLNKISPEKPVFNTDLVGPHFGWTNNLGHSIVDTTTLTIGGNLVETLSGQLMEVIDEFQTPLEKVNEKNRQLCRSDNGFTQTTYGYSNVNQTVTTHLPFWFSRGDPGCALPIDALNVDEVRLTVNFKPVTSLYYTDSRAATPVLGVEGGSLQPMANSPFYYEDSSGNLMPNIEPNRPINNPLLAFPKLNMTSNLAIQESYLIVEYIYLDKAEANRLRIADIQVPIVQHYILNPQDTQGTTYARLYLDIPNPTRDLFFFCQRYEAPSLNAHFLATKDLYKGVNKPYALWWPDASGLDARLYGNLRPGFSRSGSEPIRWLALNYNETLTRYSTENVAVFRSLFPSIEQRKAPWINRYYYNMPLGLQNGLNPFSTPLGEANLDKVKRLTLSLGFHGKTGDPTDVYVERFLVRVFAETYNILRIYGGRGTTMFAY